MSLLVRAALYAFCLLLVMIVYVGQRHTNARDTLRGALRATAKVFAWTVIGAAVMLLLQALFID